MPEERHTSPAEALFTSKPELRTEVSGSSLLATLKQKARKVQIDGTNYYILEGDLAVDDAQLELYVLQRETLDRARDLELVPTFEQPSTAGLVADTEGGRIIRWKQGMVLTYCILRNTFSEQSRYDLVRASMTTATQDWETICGVKFEHKQALDASNGTANPGCLFTVREFDTGGQFIAAAFFPSDVTARRHVLIDPSFFGPGLGFDNVGVLRHELGHVLGFRHEHIRSGAPPGCPDEDTFGVINLTDYDPRSVMHYFCGGVGDERLALTDKDRTGAQRLYGPPLKDFVFVE